MKKAIILLLVVLSVLPQTLSGKNRNSYVIGFYNVENLFDTVHDEGKNDYEFLPDGLNRWTDGKYQAKLHNIATVIRSMEYENGMWHSVLGLAEVENIHALRDLVSQPELRDAGFEPILVEGPDRRGIDCALLYRPSDFTPLEIRSIPFDFDTDDIDFEYGDAEKADFRTRDILMVRGKLGKDMFAFFVGHFPSRRGDKGSDLRSRSAELMYGAAEELTEKYPGIKIVCMGDMNDNPADVSMTRYLHGTEDIDDMGKDDFFAPFMAVHHDGIGSEEYRGEWNLFDQILVNSELVNPGKKGSLRICRMDGSKYYGRVFSKPFMVQQDGKYEGTPYRTFSGGTFIHGYSDHYPTYIVVSKWK